MQFKLEIAAVNAAFFPDPSEEISRLLRSAADKVDAGATEGILFDVNGNRVGHWYFEAVGDEDA